MKHLIKVELHCHTIYSRDSLNTLEDVLKKCDAIGIERLAITDHNTIRGAMRAKEMDPQRVIVGEEILTAEGGEILALFVKEEIPRGMPALEAMKRLKEQSAFISLSHPFDFSRHGWADRQLAMVLPYLDAVEVFNSRSLIPEINERAGRFAGAHGLAGTVGSDAHTLAEVGRSTLTLPEFENAAELRERIREAQQEIQRSSVLVRLGTRYGIMMQRFFPGRIEAQRQAAWETFQAGKSEFSDRDCK